jgi:hypothetical protein
MFPYPLEDSAAVGKLTSTFDKSLRVEIWPRSEMT